MLASSNDGVNTDGQSDDVGNPTRRLSMAEETNPNDEAPRRLGAGPS